MSLREEVGGVEGEVEINPQGEGEGRKNELAWSRDLDLDRLPFKDIFTALEF